MDPTGFIKKGSGVPPLGQSPTSMPKDAFSATLQYYLNKSGLNILTDTNGAPLWIKDSIATPGIDCDDYAEAMLNYYQSYNIAHATFSYLRQSFDGTGHVMVVAQFEGHFYLVDPTSNQVSPPLANQEQVCQMGWHFLQTGYANAVNLTAIDNPSASVTRFARFDYREPEFFGYHRGRRQEFEDALRRANIVMGYSRYYGDSSPRAEYDGERIVFDWWWQ